MSDAAKMSSDLVSLQDDLAALKRDVSSLVEHLKIGATNTAQTAAAQLDDGAHKLYRTISAEGERQIKAIEQQVEDQPLVALLVAFGIGYVGGRLLSR